jgi:hypothetical protein
LRWRPRRADGQKAPGSTSSGHRPGSTVRPTPLDSGGGARAGGRSLRRPLRSSEPRKCGAPCWSTITGGAPSARGSAPCWRSASSIAPGRTGGSLRCRISRSRRARCRPARTRATAPCGPWAGSWPRPLRDWSRVTGSVSSCYYREAAYAGANGEAAWRARGHGVASAGADTPVLRGEIESLRATDSHRMRSRSASRLRSTTSGLDLGKVFARKDSAAERSTKAAHSECDPEILG